MSTMRWAVLLWSSCLLLVGEPVMAYEAIYPKTPVGKIEVKQIPARTILAAQGKGDPFESRNESFGKLFSYIQRNNVAMTVPVEASATTNTMQFFVGGKDKSKSLKPSDNVEIRKLQPITVVSIGIRGAYTREHYDEGLKKIRTWLSSHPEWQAEGEPYSVYWNSPFVPGFLKLSEVHQPVLPAKAKDKDKEEDNTPKPDGNGTQSREPEGENPKPFGQALRPSCLIRRYHRISMPDFISRRHWPDVLAVFSSARRTEPGAPSPSAGPKAFRFSGSAA